jgi:hypothetical protein
MQEKSTSSRSWVTCTKHKVEFRLGELRKPVSGPYNGHSYIHHVSVVKPKNKPIIWAVGWSGSNSYNFILNDDKPYAIHVKYVNFMHIVENHLVFEDAYEIVSRKAISPKLQNLVDNIKECLEHSL